jgi:murein DD-endopeptidase MepM/ murein hydrolase activator NlpD
MLTIEAGAQVPIATVPAAATSAATITPRPTPDWSTPGPVFDYLAAPGDTLAAISARFAVDPSEIPAGAYQSAEGYLPAGARLLIPNRLGPVSYGVPLLPDSEIVYSPAAADFDVGDYATLAGGLLGRYEEELSDGRRMTGAQIVQTVADDLSVNPRLLLGLIEYRSGWVFGEPPGGPTAYPLGFRIAGRSGLYQELMVAATQLNRGYYGWRDGSLVETEFDDGSALRFHPALNAGSVAVLHVLALLQPHDRWLDAVYGPDSFPSLYASLFGDPWEREAAFGPPLTSGLVQPPLELPFLPGERWSFTGGPHPAWNAGTPRGALDFSPITGEERCAVSGRWVTAAAPGVIARAGSNAVLLDLDGDGREQTGWVLLYYHVSNSGMIPSGARVEVGTPLGHPSCEGGRATGKHVHIARKFNGEWIAADGPVPLVLSGWQTLADDRNYYGSLVRGTDRVTSDSSGAQGSTIVR